MLPKDKLYKGFAILILIASLLVPRFYQLNHFVTPDEPAWLRRSGNFYYALGQREWSQTFQREHPGVINMWAGTIGYLLVFPEYRGLGQGYFDSSIKQNRFFAEYGIDPLDVLTAGRAVNVLFFSGSLLVSFFLLTKLLDFWPAWFASFMIGSDAFTVSLTRLLHLDGLLAGFMLMSALAMIVYVRRGRDWKYLALSAAAGGIGFLTKSPGIFMIPYVALILLLDQWSNKGFSGNRKSKLWITAKSLTLWIFFFWVVFIVLWPATWVEPWLSLRRVFGLALAYAEEGHSSSLFFNGEIIDGGRPGLFFYPWTLLWRMTIPTFLGIFVLAINFIRIQKKPWPQTHDGWVMVFSGFFILFFTVFITISKKQFDRYLIPVYPFLSLIAAVAWFRVLGSFEFGSLSAKWKEGLRYTCFACLFLIQGHSLVNTAPYYMTYYNPLMGGPKQAPKVLQIGWGEGLDEAGRFLNNLSDNNEVSAFSWYHIGPFSYYFEGDTVEQSMNERITDETYDLLFDSDYLVIYIHQWQREIPSSILEPLKAYQPLKTIVINNIPYVDIYRVADLDPSDFQP